MNPAEIIIVIFIMFVLSLTASRTLQSRDEAELARDVAVVRAVALRYVNLKCSNPPPTAVTLATATAALGTTVQVQHPNRWRIVLTPRPGRIVLTPRPAPPGAIEYRIGSDTWQWVYLLDTYPAVAQTGHVRLHVYRQPGSPNRRGFQGLLENTLC